MTQWLVQVHSLLLGWLITNLRVLRLCKPMVDVKGDEEYRVLDIAIECR